MVRSALLAAALLAATAAHAFVGSTDGAGGIDGSIRTLVGAIDNYDAPLLFDGSVDALSQTLLRITAAGKPRPWLAYEIHGVQAVDYQSARTVAGNALIGLVPGDVRYRALDASDTWHEGGDVRATAFLDRGNVTLHLPHADVTAGRQAITFSKAYFWNPLDVFLAFDPSQFDRDYKPGVDAVRLDVPLGAFAGVNLVGAAGRTLDGLGVAEEHGTFAASWFGSAVMGRLFGTLRGWDLSLQGGKIYGGYQVGGGAVGEAGPLEVRLEAAQLFAQPSPALLPGLLPPDERLVESGTTVVAGIGHRFENTFTIESEFFWNGLGDTQNLEASLLRFRNGETLDLSEHLLGVVARYDVLPILVADLGTIASLDDGSFQFQPRLTWSATDEVEVLAGAIVNAGTRPLIAPGTLRLRSEFGTFPDLYYAEVKLYF